MTKQNMFSSDLDSADLESKEDGSSSSIPGSFQIQEEVQSPNSTNRTYSPCWKKAFCLVGVVLVLVVIVVLFAIATGMTSAVSDDDGGLLPVLKTESNLGNLGGAELENMMKLLAKRVEKLEEAKQADVVDAKLEALTITLKNFFETSLEEIKSKQNLLDVNVKSLQESLSKVQTEQSSMKSTLTTVATGQFGQASTLRAAAKRQERIEAEQELIKAKLDLLDHQAAAAAITALPEVTTPRSEISDSSRIELISESVATLMANMSALTATNKMLKTDLELLSRDGLKSPMNSDVSQLREDVDDLKTKLFLNAKVPKTCHEYLSQGLSKSGFYEIDPDGPSYGEGPIKAYCNFEKGTTEIRHSTMDPISITACPSADCFSVKLNYSEAPLSQILDLIRLSSSCQQSIRFDCYHTHLSGFGTWQDRHGDSQTYFDGANFGHPLCACAADSSCRFSPLGSKCNCDVSPSVREWLSDSGHVTNKTALPVTGFKYGFLSGENNASVSIGPLECRGEETVFGGPGTGCAELRQQGQTSSGFYVFQERNGTLIETYLAFCNMTTSYFDPQIERRIGSLSSFTDMEKIAEMISIRIDVTAKEIKKMNDRVTTSESLVDTKLNTLKSKINQCFSKAYSNYHSQLAMYTYCEYNS